MQLRIGISYLSAILTFRGNFPRRHYRLEIKQIAVHIELEYLRVRIDLDGQRRIEVNGEAFGNEHVVEAQGVLNSHNTDVVCGTGDE